MTEVQLMYIKISEIQYFENKLEQIILVLSNGQSSPSIDHIEGRLPNSIPIEKEITKFRFKTLKQKHEHFSLRNIELEFSDKEILKIMPEGDIGDKKHYKENLVVKPG